MKLVLLLRQSNGERGRTKPEEHKAMVWLPSPSSPPPPAPNPLRSSLIQNPYLFHTAYLPLRYVLAP